MCNTTTDHTEGITVTSNNPPVIPIKITSPSYIPNPWQAEGGFQYLKLVHRPELKSTLTFPCLGWPLTPSPSHCHSTNFQHTHSRFPVDANGVQLTTEKIPQIEPKTSHFAYPAITSKWSWPDTVRKAGTLKKWGFSTDSFASFDVCKSKNKQEVSLLVFEQKAQLLAYFLFFC